MVVHSTQASLVRSWRRTRGFRLSSGRRLGFFRLRIRAFRAFNLLWSCLQRLKKGLRRRSGRCSGRVDVAGLQAQGVWLVQLFYAEAIADCLSSWENVCVGAGRFGGCRRWGWRRNKQRRPTL
ncbi:hypothetical protein HPP92_018321 [Vanilla planifolia]|uniref:Uncharacterized protein n=1 Tax=Vanilla planifolia TaxID=51239 RepID=A0A835QHU4_VANPL|nr:hypothetical protein HPP92_018321 [Vanilla planifolia]